MTQAERTNPKIINGSRRARIASGSGVAVFEVNQLVDRFFEARKMMAQMAGGMGLPGARRQTKKGKGKKGKKGGGKAVRGGATPPRMPGGFPGMPPGGMPKGMPKGVPQIPPGTNLPDLTKLKFPKK
jgi:signal recognition particle subunit SRP54